MVNALLADAPRFDLYRANLEATFGEWRSAGRALGPMIDHSPALQEARPLASNLSQIAEVGLEAMSHLATGSAAFSVARRAIGET